MTNPSKKDFIEKLAPFLDKDLIEDIVDIKDDLNELDLLIQEARDSGLTESFIEDLIEQQKNIFEKTIKPIIDELNELES